MDALFGMEPLPMSGDLTAAVDGWIGAVDGVPAPMVAQCRMLAGVLESQCAAVQRMAAQGVAAPSAWLVAVTKVNRELRDMVRAAQAAADRANAPTAGEDPLGQLLAGLSAPIMGDAPH